MNDLYRVHLMLGLMWLSATLMTTTRRLSEQQKLAGASIWGPTIILGLVLLMNIARLVLLSP